MGGEENGKGRGKRGKCVFTILVTEYFSKKKFGASPLHLKKGDGGSIEGLQPCRSSFQRRKDGSSTTNGIQHVKFILT